MRKLKVVRRPVVLSLGTKPPSDVSAAKKPAEPTTTATDETDAADETDADTFDDTAIAELAAIAMPRTSTATVTPSDRLAVMKRTRK